MFWQWLTAAGSLWNLLLVLVVVVGLGGFVNTLYLRRLWRARRIAHLRERRLLREAAERK